MTRLPMTRALRLAPGPAFWRKTFAVLRKEFIQLKRDRISFAMIVMIPLVQLLLFGYAINTTPRDLPTAVLLQERSDVGRSILAALKNTRYFKVTHLPTTEAEFDRLFAAGTVLFGVEIPANFERALRRGERPAMLMVADATDPVASGSALSALSGLVQSALVHDRVIPAGTPMPFQIVTHARYNPAGETQLNIVPGLVGTILTMTMLIFTALSVTREIERGTMEHLLAMPITPVEIMFGKIIPYILVGFAQATMIIAIGVLLFGVPLVGNLGVLAVLSTLFIAANLSIGYLLHDRTEPIAGHADVDHVFPAEHPPFGIHVPVRRHAGLGTMDRRGTAADALSAHRALDHAEGILVPGFALRCGGTVRLDADRHDHRGDPLSQDA